MLFLALLAAAPALAQEPEEGSGCRPDEIDLGDYCASRLPQEPGKARKKTRVTSFRSRSMMPGRVGSEPALADPPKQSEPFSEGTGYGVQLGVFSERSRAVAVAREAGATMGGPFRLSPVPRGERILWACIHGPFPDQNSATVARRRLLQETRFRDAFVKPLAQMKLMDVEHARTEK